MKINIKSYTIEPKKSAYLNKFAKDFIEKWIEKSNITIIETPTSKPKKSRSTKYVKKDKTQLKEKRCKKELKKETSKRFYLKNRGRFLEYSKEYYRNNKERTKLYIEKNKEKYKERFKSYYLKNKEDISRKAKEKREAKKLALLGLTS